MPHTYTGSSGEPAQAATGHPIYLDHKAIAVGTYNTSGPYTQWTFDFDYFPTTAIHLATGTVFTPTRSGTSNTFYYNNAANLSSGNTVFGRAETMDLYLSRPYVRDDNGRPIFDDRLILRSMDVKHSRSVAFDVQSDGNDTTARNTYMRKALLANSGSTYGISDASAHRHTLGIDAELGRYIIFNNTTRPSTIVGVDFEGIAMRGLRA